MRDRLPIFAAVGRMVSISPLKDEVLDALFDLVVELVAVVAEELDAVVLVGIVRGAEGRCRRRREATA